jgi:hypothetical protein
MADDHIRDRQPVTEGFLAPGEIEDRAGALRAALDRLENDPAEVARIDALIAGADDMFGTDLTLFEDPPPQAAAQRDALVEGRDVVISGSHAQPRIEAGRGMDGGGARELSIVVSGAHAKAHIHVRGDGPKREADELAEKVEELERVIASMEAEAADHQDSKAGRVLEPGPSGLAAVLGIASAAVASHSLVGASAIVAVILAAASAVWVIVLALPVISGTVVAQRSGNFFPGLRLLLGRDPVPGDLPAGGRSHRRRAVRSRADKEEPEFLRDR